MNSKTPKAKPNPPSDSPPERKTEVKFPLTDSSVESNEGEVSHAGNSSLTDAESVSKHDRDESNLEIQSIMDQFKGATIESGGDRSLISKPDVYLPGHDHPPRLSSLGAIQTGSVEGNTNESKKHTENAGEIVRPEGRYVTTGATHHDSGTVKSLISPASSPAINKSLPPAPDPESDLPFDFHRFLEQLRHRTADPVAKFLRSFLLEFGKKQWMAHEQVKIISDFLSFIAGKMQQCDVWRQVSDAEFDNAREGMEKLVMNRLYAQTFSPAIPPQSLYSPPKGKSKMGEKQPQNGRRGQHQEDVERDEILAQKVKIYSWVREEHLDIPQVGENSKKFLALAQKELLKINSYRAPRDKVICVLNCCKVIFGLLRSYTLSDTSADSFIPLLIYVVLQASPEHLVSNIQYILRFRSQDRLGGEAGYYLSSLMGAIQFIENLDRTSLTITDAEFESNVEAAVSAIAERVGTGDSQPFESRTSSGSGGIQQVPGASRNSRQRQGEEQGQISDTDGPGIVHEEKVAVGNLLKSIQKPLSSFGRIFSEETPSRVEASSEPAELMNDEDSVARRLSPAVFLPPQDQDDGNLRPTEDRGNTRLAAEDHTAQNVQHKDVIDQLVSMFPALDRDVIEDVVRVKDGRVGSAVDACLALNT